MSEENTGKPLNVTPAPESKPAVTTPPAAKQERNKDKAVVATTKAPVVVTPAPEPDPEVVVETATLVNDGDDDQVKALKAKLAEIVEATKRPGTNPEDFKLSANLVLQMTKFVLQFPKVPVLDALLVFFEDNIDDVASASKFLRGVNTLSMTDEQQVSYLHSLFADLARRQNVSVNGAKVTQVLKKPEIANYYARRNAAFVQAAKQQQM